MPSNAYMKPEKSKGYAILQAYGAFSDTHDFNIEAQRVISDIYWYIKNETNINFSDLVALSIEESNSWSEQD